jgi:hypothetical protein
MKNAATRLDGVAIAKQKRQPRSESHTPTTTAASSRKTALASPQARLKTAHAKFMQTKEGTTAYDQAWEELLDTLFVNAK